jgi:hypothetical protein
MNIQDKPENWTKENESNLRTSVVNDSKEDKKRKTRILSRLTLLKNNLTRLRVG